MQALHHLRWILFVVIPVPAGGVYGVTLVTAAQSGVLNPYLFHTDRSVPVHLLRTNNTYTVLGINGVSGLTPRSRVVSLAVVVAIGVAVAPGNTGSEDCGVGTAVKL